MTDGNDTGVPVVRAVPRRRWWEKQRFVIPIAMAILAPAVFLVAGVVTGGRADADLHAAGATPRDAAAAADVTGPRAADGDGTATATGGPRSPAVCRRILALRTQLEAQGVNPVKVYLQMQRIQQDAQGTRVAAQADHAVRTMEDFVAGEAGTAEVVAAGTALVSAC